MHTERLTLTVSQSNIVENGVSGYWLTRGCECFCRKRKKSHCSPSHDIPKREIGFGYRVKYRGYQNFQPSPVSEFIVQKLFSPFEFGLNMGWFVSLT
jgi:hypothetical protein